MISSGLAAASLRNFVSSASTATRTLSGISCTYTPRVVSGVECRKCA